MAVAIPVLAVVGGVSAGAAIAAGAAVTFASAMAVAGGMAAGLGLLTGDKDLKRLGSTLSAVGGLAGAFSSAAGALGTAEAANGALDTAGKVAGQVEGASSAAGAAGAPGYNIGDIGNYAGATPGADLGAPAPYANETAKFARQGTPPAALSPAQDIAGKLTGSEGGALTKAFQTAPTTAGLPASGEIANPLKDYAAGITQKDIATMLERGSTKAGSLMGQAWDGIGGALNSAGQWVQKNPMAASMAFQTIGGAVNSVAGPEAEAMRLRQSLIDRARQNANSPVRLQYLTPKTA